MRRASTNILLFAVLTAMASTECWFWKKKQAAAQATGVVPGGATAQKPAVVAPTVSQIKKP
jgi:hypothetical protein